MRPKKFTVILLRPDYISDNYGTDVYVAHVKAPDEYKAIPAAQKEVFTVDTKEGMAPKSIGDYAAILVFAGHQDVKLFNWQA